MDLKEGYIGNWKNYPKDEVKVRVARPGPLGVPKDLWKKLEAKKIDFEDYQLAYMLHVVMDTKARLALMDILTMLRCGKTVRLMCYEKEPPCHRFTLKKAIETLFDRALLEKVTKK